jgi:Tfp pilus assembly protein PilF
MGEAFSGVYYAVFNPSIVSVSNSLTIYPYGILHKVMPTDTAFASDAPETVWSSYITEAIYEPFQRDFMSREVCAFFHFARGKYFFSTDRPDLGLTSIQQASRIGYDHPTIHSDMAVFLTDRGFFEQARLELKKALTYHEDLSGVYNNWGYYYHKLGDYDQAEASYSNAIELSPQNQGYYNNLGLALYDASRKDEAADAFRKSLAINTNQPKLRKFLKEHGLEQTLIE